MKTLSMANEMKGYFKADLNYAATTVYNAAKDGSFCQLSCSNESHWPVLYFHAEKFVFTVLNYWFQTFNSGIRECNEVKKADY